VGTAAPALSGSDFAGDTVSFTPGEGPAVLVFLAHWCPHCQAEVPRMVSWLEDNPDAGGVEVIAVPTGTDPTAPNFPPSVWLERENWPAPIIVDDADSTAGTAFGVGSYPFWVMVGSDGTVVGRLSGELGEDQIGELMTAVAGS
jgi:thiol-disulfide isomerase/thioredoxin